MCIMLYLLVISRFERDYIVPGQAWNGGDRHNGEIAAFHLNRSALMYNTYMNHVHMIS